MNGLWLGIPNVFSILCNNVTSPVKLCCTQYHESPIPVKALKLGTVQEITGFCNIKAVIFKTVKNKLVCTNPDSEWVKAAMETVPIERKK
uniref:Chemokine interleukin-8-like domain-containing protein n=1 Tax=Sphaeramia orbicularis TaxID=375764 RepID=A0A673ALR5_9TELE